MEFHGIERSYLFSTFDFSLSTFFIAVRSIAWLDDTGVKISVTVHDEGAQ
jgi:hypothetical protein